MADPHALVVHHLTRCLAWHADALQRALGVQNCGSALAFADCGEQDQPMSDDPAFRPSWHAAAERATFVFYEPDGADQRWAGSFSSDGTQIEVIANVNGVEVAVSTSRPNSPFSDDMQRRVTLSEMVWHNLMEGADAELTLPHVITVQPDVRPITIGTDVLTVSGMRLADNSQWVGIVHIADVSVRIETSATAPLSLRPCINPSELPEFPPDD